MKRHVESLIPSLDQLQRPGLNTITKRAGYQLCPTLAPLPVLAKGRPPTREGRGGTGTDILNTDQIVPTQKC